MNKTLLFSNNVQILKLLSILTVTLTHYYTMKSNLHYRVLDYTWCLSAIGLVVFSYTSGYFTAIRYGHKFDTCRFWQHKISRLGYSFTTLNAFLIVLFLFEGRQNIFSIQSFVSWIGMKGFMDWFGIPNHSPFGAGLWFLTLLLLFYLAYPLIERINQKAGLSWLFTAASTALCLYLVDAAPVGHTLWITLAGFLLGVFMAKRSGELTRAVSLGGVVLLGSSMLILNLKLQYVGANSALLLGLGVLAVESCRHVRLPGPLTSLLLPASNYILEIYILHIYLFVQPLPTRGLPSLAFDSLISLALVFVVAIPLAKVAHTVKQIVENRNTRTT